MPTDKAFELILDMLTRLETALNDMRDKTTILWDERQQKPAKEANRAVVIGAIVGSVVSFVLLGVATVVGYAFKASVTAAAAAGLHH